MKIKYIIFSACFLCFCVDVHAAPSELAQINAQIKKTEQQNRDLEQRVKTSNRDIEQTKKKLVNAADKVGTLETQRADVARKIIDLDNQRDKLSAELEKNQERIADAAASILFVASNPSFDSENMHDYVLTSALLSGVADRFDAQIQDATIKINQLAEIREQRAVEKEKLDRTAQKYVTEKKDLDKLLRTRATQNEKLKNEQHTVQNKLRDLSARAKNISELSAGVGSSRMSSDSTFSRRKMNSPVRGKLVVKFGEKTALGLQSDGWRIRVRGDVLVVAPADGMIKFADSFKGFGKVFIISHKNGYNTVLTNLGTLDALIGQEVLAGEPIGRMDPSRPEMYLEVRRGDNVVNPSRIFNEPN